MTRWLAGLLLVTGCSVLGSNSGGLTKRCERSLPALDTGIAIASGVLALALSSEDGDGGAELVGVGLVFGASAGVGYSKAGQCRRREAERPSVPIASFKDEFLGAQKWRTTMWVYPRESPLVALERAYQRAAVICEGRGLSALSATRLEPRRPEQVTLTYKCH